MKEKNWFLIGWIFTPIYLIVFGAMALNNGTPIYDLPLNELGDFLSGAFAPLAFLWLVLAFVQQGIELRISTDEMRNAVEQSEDQAQSLKASVKLEESKFASDEWSRTHQEMSSILSLYTYHYSKESYVKKRDKQCEEQKEALLILNKEGVLPDTILEIDPEVSAQKNAQTAWEQYANGDKNTFFRTVANHCRHKPPNPVMKSFLVKSRKRVDRYLKLHSYLETLMSSQTGANTLLLSEEMTSVVKFFSDSVNQT